MLTTDDKFHPLNTLQRALDYGDPLDRDEVRALIAAYEELEATHGDERDELAIRIDALEDERDDLQAELSSALIEIERHRLAYNERANAYLLQADELRRVKAELHHKSAEPRHA